MICRAQITSAILLLMSVSLTIAQVRDPRHPIIITKASHGREARAAAARHGLDDKTKKILGQFFNMLGNFFSILQDPNNAEHVTANVTNMLAGAVNIVAEGVKSGDLILDGDNAHVRAYAEEVSKKLTLPLVELITL